MNGKLLIISYSFPQDNVPAAQRPYFMSKYFKEDSLMDTIVLTSKNSLSSLGKSEWADIKNLKIIYTGTKEKSVKQPNPLNDIPSKKKQKWLEKIFQSLSRELLIPDKGIHWFFQGWNYAKKILSNNSDIHFIYSTSPSFVNHMIAYKIRKEFNVKWVADLRDFYYTDNIQDKHFFFRKMIDKTIEKKIINKADKLTFISKGMMEEYGKNYTEIRLKSQVIYNGFDESEFNFPPSNFTLTEKLIIFYGGSFYKGLRSPKPLLTTLEWLISHKKISSDKIEIKIAGNVPAEIFEEFKTYKIYPSIKLLGLISRKQVLNEMMNAHLLWLIIGNEKAHYLGFPVKGYEYIGARKHILAFTPLQSEPARILNELNCGTVFGLAHEDEILNGKKMEDLYKKFELGYFNKPIFIQSSLLEKYTRHYQAHELYNILLAMKK